MMTTYGKKKRLLLSSFSVLRDSDSAPKDEKDKKDRHKKGGSTFNSIRVLQDTIHQPLPTSHNDTVEEMANMLLDDTPPNPSQYASGERLSFRFDSNCSIDPSLEEKALPQLPSLVFNGDDAWVMRLSPVVTASGASNETLFPSIIDDESNLAGRKSGRQIGHTRMGSTPPIPRKSSKRDSARPKIIHLRTQPSPRDQSVAISTKKKLPKSISTPNQLLNLSGYKSSTHIDANDVNGKIKSMLEATEALKGKGSRSMLHRPLVPITKHHLNHSKVLKRMKTALNDRLSVRSSNISHDSVTDRLLDISPNEMHDDEDAITPTTITSHNIRVNEGDNLGKPKIQRLTGHGKVARKPLGDDGKSWRSRRSLEDPFSSRPSSRNQDTGSTTFAARFRDDLSMSSINDDLSRPSSFLLSTLDLSRLKKSKLSPLVYETSLDDLLSSSPVAQSTPRIRLEPEFGGGGKKTLRNVPAETRSLFDPDTSSIGHISEMELDIETVEQSLPSATEAMKRKSFHWKSYKLGINSKKMRVRKYPLLNKIELESLENGMKKHPSPSKDELETLEHRLKEKYHITSDAVAPVLHSRSESIPVLTPRDPNQPVKESKSTRKGSKAGGIRSIESMSDIPKLSRSWKSSISISSSAAINTKPSVENRSGHRYPVRPYFVDGSEMEIDDLQLEVSTYQIGMRV